MMQKTSPSQQHFSELRVHPRGKQHEKQTLQKSLLSFLALPSTCTTIKRTAIQLSSEKDQAFPADALSKINTLWLEEESKAGALKMLSSK